MECKLEEHPSKTMNKKIKELEKNNEILTEKLSKLESASVELKKFKCLQCNFVTNSEKGLKTHIKRMHTASTNKDELELFPKTCDLCEKEIGSKSEMKKHMKSHSYKHIEYKCEECELFSDSKQ